MDDGIVVSIFCLTYNHEKYIRQCLEGFVNQVTSFKYEVFVHDDASTDNTAEIIQQYAERYPDIIKPIIQTENQYSKKVKIISTWLLPLASGRYMALCEGDDYWCDSNKLQKQVDMMELHQECSLCLHRVRDISEDGRNLNTFKPEKNMSTRVIGQEEFLYMACSAYNFQTSSYLIKMRDYIQYTNNPPEFRKIAPVGDQPILLYFGQLGPVAYLSDTCSCYRNQSTGSWSERVNNGKSEERLLHYRKMVEMYEAFDRYTEGRYRVASEIGSRNFAYFSAWHEGKYEILIQKRFRLLMSKESIKTRIMVLIRGYAATVKNKLRKDQ